MLIRALISVLLLANAVQAAKTLEIYFIDTEGGQSTLVVSPSGQAMLIDTGYAGFGGRDANRIATAAKLASEAGVHVAIVNGRHPQGIALGMERKIGTYFPPPGAKV